MIRRLSWISWWAQCNHISPEKQTTKLKIFEVRVRFDVHGSRRDHVQSVRGKYFLPKTTVLIRRSRALGEGNSLGQLMS